VACYPGELGFSKRCKLKNPHDASFLNMTKACRKKQPFGSSLRLKDWHPFSIPGQVISFDSAIITGVHLCPVLH